jgi:hypothetical protein
LKLGRCAVVTWTWVAATLITIEREGHTVGPELPDALGEGDGEGLCFVALPVWWPECVLTPALGDPLGEPVAAGDAPPDGEPPPCGAGPPGPAAPPDGPEPVAV